MSARKIATAQSTVASGDETPNRRCPIQGLATTETNVPNVTPVTRTGFLDHIRILAGSARSAGWWVPDTAAGELHLRPGDSFLVGAGGVPRL